MLFSPLASSPSRRSRRPYTVVEHRGGDGYSSSAPSRLACASADYASGRSSLSPTAFPRSRSSSTTRSQPLRSSRWQILGEGALIKPLSDEEAREALHEQKVLLKTQRTSGQPFTEGRPVIQRLYESIIIQLEIFAE